MVLSFLFVLPFWLAMDLALIVSKEREMLDSLVSETAMHEEIHRRVEKVCRKLPLCSSYVSSCNDAEVGAIEQPTDYM